MGKWVEMILRGIFGIIMGIAAVLTSIILSPFLFIMWLIRLWDSYFNGDDTSQ